MSEHYTKARALLSQGWSLTKNSGILENIVPDDGQGEDIRAFFFRYFVELNDMYKFYSAVNSGGGTHTLEYVSYVEILLFLGSVRSLSSSSHSAIRLSCASSSPRLAF